MAGARGDAKILRGGEQEQSRSKLCRSRGKDQAAAPVRDC